MTEKGCAPYLTHTLFSSVRYDELYDCLWPIGLVVLIT